MYDKGSPKGREVQYHFLEEDLLNLLYKFLSLWWFLLRSVSWLAKCVCIMFDRLFSNMFEPRDRYPLITMCINVVCMYIFICIYMYIYIYLCI